MSALPDFLNFEYRPSRLRIKRLINLLGYPSLSQNTHFFKVMPVYKTICQHINSTDTVCIFAPVIVYPTSGVHVP